jgi:hypothetical protein
MENPKLVAKNDKNLLFNALGFFNGNTLNTTSVREQMVVNPLVNALAVTN